MSDEPSYHDVVCNMYKGPIYEDYWMKVVYDIEDETHSGYCSDPYDIETEYKVRTYKFRIPLQFDIHDLSHNNIQRLLDFFEVERESCGYCKCYTITTIIAIRIGTKGIYKDLYRRTINRTKPIEPSNNVGEDDDDDE